MVGDFDPLLPWIFPQADAKFCPTGQIILLCDKKNGQQNEVENRVAAASIGILF